MTMLIFKKRKKQQQKDIPNQGDWSNIQDSWKQGLSFKYNKIFPHSVSAAIQNCKKLSDCSTRNLG